MLIVVVDWQRTARAFKLFNRDHVSYGVGHRDEARLADDDQVRAPEVTAVEAFARTLPTIHDPGDGPEGHEGGLTPNAVRKRDGRVVLIGGLGIMPFPARDQHLEARVTDGQDGHDAHEVRVGPKYELSLYARMAKLCV
ncbi:hypothetical protein [Nonomuraea sp. NPDC048916]|uniref:hypothetical protein n=1 Tax=Nonomuraea sp. NPDC048916 TaxID=3154232 RepID=UPI0033EE3040